MRAHACQALLALLGRYAKPFIAPQPPHTLVVHQAALAAGLFRSTPPSPPGSLLGELAKEHTLLGLLVGHRWRIEPLRRAVQPDHPTGSAFGDPEPVAQHRRRRCVCGSGSEVSLGDLAEHVDVERLVRDQLLQPGVLQPRAPSAASRPMAFIPPYWASHRCHVDSAISRCRHTSSSSLPGGQLLVALGELADDLIRRVPPALPGCHGAVLLPALTGITVAQHLDHYEGLSSTGRG